MKSAGVVSFTPIIPDRFWNITESPTVLLLVNLAIAPVVCASRGVAKSTHRSADPKVRAKVVIEGSSCASCLSSVFDRIETIRYQLSTRTDSASSRRPWAPERILSEVAW